jgi:hypothetical protein
MKLEIQNIWSADLPSLDGYPENIYDFQVGIQLSIGEVGKPGGEVFYLTVISPNALSRIEPGIFLDNTLVIDEFDWDVIRRRITKLFSFCQNATDWKEVILRLAGCLRYSDGEIWNL